MKRLRWEEYVIIGTVVVGTLGLLAMGLWFGERAWYGNVRTFEVVNGHISLTMIGHENDYIEMDFEYCQGTPVLAIERDDRIGVVFNGLKELKAIVVYRSPWAYVWDAKTNVVERKPYSYGR